MTNELIQKRLWTAGTLAQRCEFKKAYALLDRVLRIYPEDLRVHAAYAEALEVEVDFVGEVCECTIEKLRKARKHHYFVLRHTTNFQSGYVHKAIHGLLRQARFLGKKRYEIRLAQIFSQHRLHTYFVSTPRAERDSS